MSKDMHTTFIRGLSAAGFHRFAAHMWGNDGDRPPVVCVHGLTRNGRDFDDLARVLATSRLVACPDIVGRGRSDWLRDPAHYAVPQYVRDMIGLLSAIGDRPVDWIGTSMGGLIGMVLAAQPGSPVRRLVLNDVGPFISAQAMAQISALVGDPVFADRGALRRAIEESIADWGDLPPATLDRLAEFGGRQRPDGTFGRSYDPAIAVPLRAAADAAVDLWPLWQSVSCPVLVLRGARSPVLTKSTATRMTVRDGVKLVEIPDCGHAPSLMVDEQIQIIEEWLDA